MKEKYMFKMNDLKSEEKNLRKEEWVKVKMIDFQNHLK
jgi:hypothetical protein